MAISTDSSPDEFSSPFFKQNKEICFRWDELFKKFDGRVNGKYNAWSYRLIGKIKSNYSWRIEVSKSSYSATGISSFLYSNIFEQLNLTTNDFNSNGSNFYIRKRKFFLDLVIRKKFKQRLSNKYILIGTNRIEGKLKEILNIISEPMELEKLYHLEVRDNLLHIDIQSYNNCYQFVSDLMNRRII